MRLGRAKPQDGAGVQDGPMHVVDTEKAFANNDMGTATPPASIDPVLEARVRRKTDTHLLPLVFALYLLAFLDRSNIGNARIAGMSTDLHMTSNDYDWLLTIFYISYIVFEPAILMWKIVPAHMWGAFVVLGWGVVSSAQAGTNSWSGMMALRFLMGAFEASYGPGIPYLLSFYYLRRELGFRCGIFLSAAPLANTFAGALAYGITSGSPSLAKWRVLFLVEGLPTVAMAAVAWFFLPDAPDKARFLTPEEREVARARGIRQVGDKTADARFGGLDWRDLGMGLLDVKAWLQALLYFSWNVSFSSLPVFLPTILAEMGFSSINAQGLTAPPFFLSFLMTITTCYIADRTQQRGLMLMALSVLGGAGYIMLASSNSVGVRYAGCFLAAAGVFPCIGNILPWIFNNQGSDSRRGTAFVIVNIVGQCGPLLGTRLYPSNEGPRYVKGHSVCAGFMFFTTILVLALRTFLVWENKKLDRRYGVIEKGSEGVGEENYGPRFRYVL